MDPTWHGGHLEFRCIPPIPGFYEKNYYVVLDPPHHICVCEARDCV